MEIITGAERRRRWRDEDKLWIVAEAEAPGAVFALVARRHDVSRGQLWKWRGQVRRGDLVAVSMVPEFMPVRVTGNVALSLLRAVGRSASVNDAGTDPAPRAQPARLGVTSRIEIVLADGTCVRVDDGVGVTALRRVMAVVRR